MRVFLIGGGDQARLCYNILRLNGHEVPVLYDRTEGLLIHWNCLVFNDENAISEHARTCDGFLVCIGNSHGQARTLYSRRLRELGLQPVSAIHPTAFLGHQVNFGEGLQAMARSVVSDYACIGDFCILNTNSVIDHDCVVGTGVHIMGSAALAGRVSVGDFSTIGTNATVLPRIKIGTNSYVGAGAVVTKDVPDDAIVAGVPARVIRYATSSELP